MIVFKAAARHAQRCAWLLVEALIFLSTARIAACPALKVRGSADPAAVAPCVDTRWSAPCYRCPARLARPGSARAQGRQRFLPAFRLAPWHAKGCPSAGTEGRRRILPGFVRHYKY